MLHILDEGWRPQTDVADLIQWDPRKYNSLADHAANCALDADKSWETWNEEGLCRALSANANLRISTDGARRGGGQAAAGMAILAYWPDGQQEVCIPSGVDSDGMVFRCLLRNPKEEVDAAGQ
eukprot:9023873-Karenia_brevis.AAC.1